jgi:hypothetical protein
MEVPEGLRKDTAGFYEVIRASKSITKVVFQTT